MKPGTTLAGGGEVCEAEKHASCNPNNGSVLAGKIYSKTTPTPLIFICSFLPLPLALFKPH